MKKKDIPRKLKFKKETVAHLGVPGMNRVRGGRDDEGPTAVQIGCQPTHNITCCSCGAAEATCSRTYALPSIRCC